MKELVKLKQIIDKNKGGNNYLSRLNIRVGNDIHENIVKEISRFGKNVSFCTGNTAMRNLGFIDKYFKLFIKHGISFTHYDNISSNPTLKQMEEGVDIARRTKPDVIFALGGGSVIDTAKVISVAAYGDIWDFVEKKEEIKQSIPIIASSTTSGTGSHVTPYAVITNTDTLEKKTLKNRFLLPKMSVVDLDITKHAPKYIVATTGFDVLCHAAEIYTRKDCTRIAREFATESLKLIAKHLFASYENRYIADKKGMAFADLYAGIALTLIGTHVPHAISHPISARFPLINHGQSLAYIMGETSRKQIEKGDRTLQEKFAEMSKMLGGDGDFVKTIDDYISKLGLDRELHKFHVEEIDQIVKDTLGYRRPSVDRCPAKLSSDDVKEAIYASLQRH